MPDTPKLDLVDLSLLRDLVAAAIATHKVFAVYHDETFDKLHAIDEKLEALWGKAAGVPPRQKQ